MISYQIYKLAHFLGIFMVLMSIAGLAFFAVKKQISAHPWKRTAVIMHGVGSLLLLIGGFGMLARLGINAGLPGWIYGKLTIWLILGATLFVLKRSQRLAGEILWVAITGAFIAAYLALYKPF